MEKKTIFFPPSLLKDMKIALRELGSHAPRSHQTFEDPRVSYCAWIH
jgi:hypothetical protein